MVKPIDLVELVMRVEALLRRADIATEKQLQAGQSGSKGRRDYGLLRGRGTSAYGKGIPDSL